MADSKKFRSEVKKNWDNDCHDWHGHVNYWGYGVFFTDKKRRRAHRVAYELTYGEIPEGLFVCHSCDNKICCDPDHLLGTVQDNVDDMCKKGLNVFRERTPSSKLKDLDIPLIRYMYNVECKPQRDIADHFGVSQYCIWAVINNRTWKHVV